MRSISTGVGLCVLGLCVLGAAALSSSQIGAQAFATPQSRHATAEPEIDALTNLSRPPIAMMPVDPNCLNPAESWFDPTPRRFATSACFGIPRSPLTSADVNGDGVIETFSELTTASRSVIKSTPGTPLVFRGAEAVLVRTVLSSQAGTTVVRGVPVLSVDGRIGQLFEQDYQRPLSCNSNAGWDIYVVGKFWADCDGDGDLDLVIGFAGDACGQSSVDWGVYYWLENIGFQRPSPNPYDLDQNGEVGASDISVLLLNFD